MATLNIKRFPDGLYEQLRSQATKEHRSISQEVIHLVSQALEETQERSILELRGLGKELWKDTDPATHVERERRSWD